MLSVITVLTSARTSLRTCSISASTSGLGDALWAPAGIPLSAAITTAAASLDLIYDSSVPRKRATTAGSVAFASALRLLGREGRRMQTFEMILASLGLFLGLLACLEAGRRVGLARPGHEAERPGLGAVDGAVFGLLGLLIAFTFSGAATRFEGRRDLIVREANAIGTAYLRLDLLREEARLSLKRKLRRYLEGRLEVYGLLPDIEAAKGALERSSALQAEIWADAIAAT